jgi:uncharacterized protein YukE
MGQVHANPEELRRFAQGLKQFGDQLRQSVSRLNGQFSRLGETWRDQKHQQFAQEYQKIVKSLDSFVQTSERHIPFLLKEADILDNYYRNRVS